MLPLADESDKISTTVRFSMADPLISDSSFVNACGKINLYDYNAAMKQVKHELPFPSVRGKVSPYTKQIIKTSDDYAAYCSSLALHRVFEWKLYSAQNILEDSRKREIAAISEAASAKRREVDAKKREADVRVELDQVRLVQDRYKTRSTILSCVVVFLCILFALSFVFRKPVSVSPSSPQPVSSSSVSSHDASSESSSVPRSDSITKSDSPTTKSDNSITKSGGGTPRPDGYVSDSYIGNKKSHKFHRSSCSYLPNFENQVIFESRESAVSAGYEPCKRCDP